MSCSEVTVGIDIGTTSVKAVAVDAEGEILARSRVPHRVFVPAPDRMEHDANRAWRRGPARALAALGDIEPRGVGIAAMVPSLTAVGRTGRPSTPGLLYGDARGRPDPSEARKGLGEAVEFLRWTAQQAPSAFGYWPAQAVANRSLGGAAAVDLGVAFASSPLFGTDGWDVELCESCGVRPQQLASIEMTGSAAGRLGGDGPPLAAPAVDVWCEQLVAGAAGDGDVHVICGTTLIVWGIVSPSDDRADAPTPSGGLWRVADSVPGRYQVGGASNAGGLFLDWVDRLLPKAKTGERLDPADIPVWTPYPRGERTPYHDPDRRAGLHGLDLTHGPAALRRAAFEASAFVARHHIDLGGVRPARLVATGGGTRMEGWIQALADAIGLPVHVAAAPEGAAIGAAWLARMAAGLETDLRASARWARTGRIVEPDNTWSGPTAERYEQFLTLSG